MAEFCVKCWEEMNSGKGYTHRGKPYKYLLAEDLCEGCGKWRRDCIYAINAPLLTQAKQYIRYTKGYYDIEFDIKK